MNQSKTDLGIVNESQLLRFGIIPIQFAEQIAVRSLLCLSRMQTYQHPRRALAHTQFMAQRVVVFFLANSAALLYALPWQTRLMYKLYRPHPQYNLFSGAFVTSRRSPELYPVEGRRGFFVALHGQRDLRTGLQRAKPLARSVRLREHGE